MTRPTSDRYLQIFSEEVQRLVATPPDRLNEPVPHLSDWTIRSVITHTAQVLRFVDLTLKADVDSPPSKSDVAAPPDGDEILTWLSDAASMVVETIGAIDSTSMRWTWAGPQPASWYSRRLCHEVSIHRWDAEVAWTTPQSIAGDIAVDGIDELLEVVAPRRLAFDELAGTGETVHLHATDEDSGEWLLTLHPTSITWEHQHSKGDVAARGPASDLVLMMWGRLAPRQLEVFGDSSLLERWQAAAAF